MANKTKKIFSFLPLYEKFIKDNKSGKRLQPNGKRISTGSIQSYACTGKLLQRFVEEKHFELHVIPERMLTRREMETEKNYWKKFYRRFTDFLYDDLGYFDNYVGLTIKNIKVFFNYLNKEIALGVGQFHKLFYARKEKLRSFLC